MQKASSIRDVRGFLQKIGRGDYETVCYISASKWRHSETAVLEE